MDKIQNYYTSLSEKYDKERRNPYFKIIEDIELKVINQCLTKDVRDVLELGCGTGIFLQQLSGKGLSLYGIDYTYGMLRFSKEKSKEKPQENIALVQGDGAHIPFSDESFDFVYSLKVLPHIPDIGNTLDEIYRVLRFGSYALLEFYNKYSFRYLFHNSNYFHMWMTPEDVYSLLRECGFFCCSRFGARTMIPSSILVNNALLGSLFRKLEMFSYNRPFLNYFSGYQMYLVQKR